MTAARFGTAAVTGYVFTSGVLEVSTWLRGKPPAMSRGAKLAMLVVMMTVAYYVYPSAKGCT